MTVRYACDDDVPLIIELAREEHAGSAWSGMQFHAEHLATVVRSFITQPGRTMLVTGGGYLAGLLQPMGFSPANVAMEYAWYARDGSGMALLAKFERWAANMGACGVLTHNHSNNPALDRVLTLRRKYSPAGQAMFKPLEAR